LLSSFESAFVVIPRRAHRATPHRDHALTVSDSVEPPHRADKAISRADSDSQLKLLAALNKSHECHKGFGILKAEEIRNQAEGHNAE
jgi:hypothetical protein